MKTSMLRKAGKLVAVVIMVAGVLAAVPFGAQAQAGGYSYGGVTFFGPAYTFPSHNGQSGNVTFFGAPPTTLPNHNGQYGNVTFLGGVQPYTYPSHNGQYGNVTFLGGRPPGTIPVNTVRPSVIPVQRARACYAAGLC